MLLIAPDSFKGTYSAREVASAIACGAADAGATVDVCPVGDGGEGTMGVALEARGGRSTSVTVHDPLGRPIVAPLGWIEDGKTAIVEMALASGLGLLTEHERDAEAASSFGAGELIAAAAAAGARRIVVAVGGSATTDGGAGAIEAIEAGGGLREVELLVACDVTTPFEHAAKLYAAQKGADTDAVERLDRRLRAQAQALPWDPRGLPFGGAAGGLSGALWAMYGARLVSGAAWVLGTVGFDIRMRRAEAVVTGEGRLDRQTFEGKLVGEIAARCASAGRPVHAVVGSSALDARQAASLGLASVRIARDEQAMAAAGVAIAKGADSKSR